MCSVAGLLGLNETEIYRKLLKNLCGMALNLDQQKFTLYVCVCTMFVNNFKAIFLYHN